MDFETWNTFLDEDEDIVMNGFIAGGKAILRYQQMTVAAKVKQAHLVTVLAEPEHKKWMVCNATTLVSETAGELAQTTGVGCCWVERSDGARVYSLRSPKESNVDCSAIAKCFGGGGHPGAAGFTVAAGNPHPWS